GGTLDASVTLLWGGSAWPRCSLESVPYRPGSPVTQDLAQDEKQTDMSHMLLLPPGGHGSRAGNRISQ
ncbi:hypothetical protein BaRGS_00000089, partial [Batillaria attramentaria]